MNYRTSLHKNMFLLIGYSKFLLLVQNSLCSIRLFTKTLTSVHFFFNIQCVLRLCFTIMNIHTCLTKVTKVTIKNTYSYIFDQHLQKAYFALRHSF